MLGKGNADTDGENKGWAGQGMSQPLLLTPRLGVVDRSVRLDKNAGRCVIVWSTLFRKTQVTRRHFILMTADGTHFRSPDKYRLS